MPQFLRSVGIADIAFRARDGVTRIDRSFQSGNLRVRLPRLERRGEPPCAVVINTAGGVAEGDRLELSVGWGEGATATVTSQAAEKVYRAPSRGADIATRLTVGDGARAEWLPQETILFDRCRLRRDARVHLAGDATFLGVEAVVLGRAAMGETVRSGALSDRLRIWRDDRLVYADALELDGDMAALMQRAAIGDGARAMAVLVHAARDAARFLEPARAALGGLVDLGGWAGRAAASAWNGLLAVRLLAGDGETLRRGVAAALAVLREGQPLPRVWRC